MAARKTLSSPPPRHSKTATIYRAATDKNNLKTRRENSTTKDIKKEPQQAGYGSKDTAPSRLIRQVGNP